MLQAFLEIFRLPSPEILDRRELIEAKRELRKAQTAMEYAQSQVQFNVTRIARLEAGFSYMEDAKSFGGSD